ncbi:hypothetical protein PAPYR_5045 [Paratrimastix pyriformis]|uniref:BCAS3 WD40 domain-containing protein n=1 Tax=Paratrimastix pyriformis TaxID=342808 RepID=A0ABQ8UIE1_9EUKA|nr:hypothetical protein PAPYR_5045 [Paratrimastix pyriformis]
MQQQSGIPPGLQPQQLPSGARAEEKRVSQNKIVQRVANYLPLADITSMLPTSLTEQSTPMENDQITFSRFDQFYTGPYPDSTKRQCLVIGYMNGFQIWDVEDLSDIREIFSLREGPIRCVVALPPPIRPVSPMELPPSSTTETIAPPPSIDGDAFQDRRPALAVVSAQETLVCLPRNMVKLFTLPEQKYFHKLTMHSDVLAVRANATYIALACAACVQLYDAYTLRPSSLIPTAPSPHGEAVFDMGPRWLACATSELPDLQQHQIPGAPAPGVPRPVRPGPYGLGASMLHSVENGPPTTTGVTVGMWGDMVGMVGKGFQRIGGWGTGGVILVWDLPSNRPVAHFRAHAHPISALAFDRSGSLLVTASVEGHSFMVFRISPGPDPTASHRHLYKLVRGVTNASVLDLSWSIDRKWLCASSLRGTSHLYSIPPDLASAVDDDGTRFLAPPQTAADQQRLLVFSRLGILSRHRLAARGGEVEAVLESGWDLCRRRLWPEVTPDLVGLCHRGDDPLAPLEAALAPAQHPPDALEPTRRTAASPQALPRGPAPPPSLSVPPPPRPQLPPDTAATPECSPQTADGSLDAITDSWEGQTVRVSHAAPVPTRSRADPSSAVSDLDFDAVLLANPDLQPPGPGAAAGGGRRPGGDEGGPALPGSQGLEQGLVTPMGAGGLAEMARLLRDVGSTPIDPISPEAHPDAHTGGGGPSAAIRVRVAPAPPGGSGYPICPVNPFPGAASTVLYPPPAPGPSRPASNPNPNSPAPASASPSPAPSSAKTTGTFFASPGEVVLLPQPAGPREEAYSPPAPARRPATTSPPPAIPAVPLTGPGAASPPLVAWSPHPAVLPIEEGPPPAMPPPVPPPQELEQGPPAVAPAIAGQVLAALEAQGFPADEQQQQPPPSPPPHPALVFEEDELPAARPLPPPAPAPAPAPDAGDDQARQPSPPPPLGWLPPEEPVAPALLPPDSLQTTGLAPEALLPQPPPVAADEEAAPVFPQPPPVPLHEEAAPVFPQPEDAPAPPDEAAVPPAEAPNEPEAATPPAAGGDVGFPGGPAVAAVVADEFLAPPVAAAPAPAAPEEVPPVPEQAAPAPAPAVAPAPPQATANNANAPAALSASQGKKPRKRH